MKLQQKCFLTETSKYVYEFNIFVGETYTLQACMIRYSVFTLDVAKCILFIFQSEAILNNRNKLWWMERVQNFNI